MPDLVFKFGVDRVEKKARTVYGWAYVSKENGKEVVDHSGDTWSPAELMKTAHDFVLRCRVGGADHLGKAVSELVESVVFTKDIQDALGIDLGKEGWFVGFRVNDDDVLARVEAGELAMFSIGGKGTREAVDG